MVQKDEDFEILLKKIENRELSEQEELALLKEVNFSYDVLNKFLDEIKVAKLSNDLKNKKYD